MAAVTALGSGVGPPFSARLTREDGQTVLWAAGELDCTVVPLLDGPLSSAPAAPGQPLTLDASHLGFLDLSGLRLLVAADARLRAAGGAGLVVRGASGMVRRIFEIMQVTMLLDDREPPKAAVRAGMPGGNPEPGEVAACLAGHPDIMDNLGHAGGLLSCAPD
jgi:anti-anti-sigma factor